MYSDFDHKNSCKNKKFCIHPYIHLPYCKIIKKNISYQNIIKYKTLNSFFDFTN